MRLNRLFAGMLAFAGLLLMLTALTHSKVAGFQLPAFAQADAAASDIIPAPKGFQLTLEDGIKYTAWIAVLLVILVVAKIFDISAVSERLTGKKVINWYRVNAWIGILFLAGGLIAAFWEFFEHGKYFAAHDVTEHGKTIKSMFMWTLLFTGVVFVITQILLFWFAFRYRYRSNKKALYYSHNNKLEMVWTIIPAVVLTFLVLRGFFTWRTITGETPAGTQNIEVFAYQFGWSARYPGADGKLGKSNFNFISESNNQMGLAVKENVEQLVKELESRISTLKYEKTKLSGKLAELKAGSAKIDPYSSEYKAMTDEIKAIESGEAASEIDAEIQRKTTQIKRIKTQLEPGTAEKVFDNTAADDQITSEIHIVKGKPVQFNFRARDVIHSAYMPDFQVQMNCVPGMPTKFHFTPVKSTAEMRKEKPGFTDFYLFCAKICGGAHYNMKIKVVVESEEEYKNWIAQQSTFVKPAAAPAPAESTTDSTGAKPIAQN